MGGFNFLAFGLAALAAGPSAARAQCRLCDAPTTAVATEKSGQEITVEIETTIDFDRLVVAADGDGVAAIRPDGSTAVQGAVTGISSRAMVGSAVVRGEPGRMVRIELPR